MGRSMFAYLKHKENGLERSEGKLEKMLSDFEKRYYGYSGAHDMAIHVAAAKTGTPEKLDTLLRIDSFAGKLTQREAVTYFLTWRNSNGNEALLGTEFTNFTRDLYNARAGYFEALNTTLNAKALTSPEVMSKPVAEFARLYDNTGNLFYLIGKTERVRVFTNPDFLKFVNTLEQKAATYLSAVVETAWKNPHSVDVLTGPDVANVRVAEFAKRKSHYIVKEYFKSMGEEEGMVKAFTNPEFMGMVDKEGMLSTILIISNYKRRTEAGTNEGIGDLKKAGRA